MDVIDNFNGSLCDLGGNGQGLEERSLLRSQSSVLRRNDDISGRNGSSPGRSTDLILQQLLAHLPQITVGKDEANVSLDVTQNPGINRNNDYPS